MDILQETYATLWKLDLVDNHCDFSEIWLNKSSRYYSMIRATGRKPSVDALGHLAANLKQRHDFYRDSHHGFLRERADHLCPVVARVWTEFNSRALESRSIRPPYRAQFRTDPELSGEGQSA
ncbi:MAG: hypothetical protein IH626_21005 [Rhodospirillales bacterium]|nr:hypothetical protein [Rhodospirillales bacterium]